MLVFASPVPSVFAGLGDLLPRNAAPVPSAEEQYFLTLAQEHERAATFARERLQRAQLSRQRQQQQQYDLESQLRLQQQLAASLQVRTPQRSPYQTPARHLFGHALPEMILEFDTEDSDACDGYAERMHRRSQVAMQERQKRAEEQSILRTLFEEQRRNQAERVAQLHRQRAEEAKAERERLIKAQREEQARRHLAARATEEDKLRQFFQVLATAMSESSEQQGTDLERKNAFRRNTVPIPVPTETTAPAPAPASAPVSPKAPARSSSPAPSTASDSSDASLHSIAHLEQKYASLRAGFTLPENLVFASSSPSPFSAPSLLYNPTNAPVHAYENALTGLLTELDAVESFGDEHVRDVRRSLARSVEAELEALELKKEDAWRKQQVSELIPIPVPAGFESTPAVVESAPVPTQSTPAPALPTTLDPAAPLAWLTARLAQESREEEDAYFTAVRETQSVESVPAPVESAPAPATDDSATSLGACLAQHKEFKDEEDAYLAAVRETQSVESVPAATETTPATDSPAPSASLTACLAQHQQFKEEEDAYLTAVRETQSVESVPAPAEPTPVTNDSAASLSACLAQHKEFKEEEDAYLTAVRETQSVGHANAEPEVNVESSSEAEHNEAHTSNEVVPSATETELATAEPTPAPESEVVVPASEPAPTTTKPEPAAFVRVFPDSDSEIESDTDLVSELADRKSTSGGDEFEMV